MELPKIKRCEYRNCVNIVSEKTNKKFCCDNCRKMEFSYVKRDRLRKKKEKRHIYELLEQVKVDSVILELYKKIY